MLEIWGWHRSLLKSCADTVEYWGNGTFLKTVSSNLTTLLISEDSELKASALRILSSLPQPRLNSAGDDSPHSASVNLFEACLEVEEAGMSLQNVRERTTRIRKVGLLVKAATFSSENIWLLEAIVSFLCSKSPRFSRVRALNHMLTACFLLQVNSRSISDRSTQTQSKHSPI